MKQKSIIIIIIVISILGAGAYLLYWRNTNQTAYEAFTDNTNKVSFNKPVSWFANSSRGHVRVSENTADPTKQTILVKVDYPDSLIPDGLKNGDQIEVGDKTMRKLDTKTDFPASEGTPAYSISLSQILWVTPDGRKIIFEISPWQKPEISIEVEKFLTSFSDLK